MTTIGPSARPQSTRATTAPDLIRPVAPKLGDCSARLCHHPPLADVRHSIPCRRPPKVACRRVLTNASHQLDGGIPNIPTSSNRKTRFRRKKAVYRERNHVERFFDELKQLRGIAIRYDKRRATFFAFI
jgi:Transposase DDE domain